MINQLKKHHRYNEALFLLIASTFCFSASMFRVFFTSTGMFLFLNWNLFLAFVPWALSTYMVLYSPSKTSRSRLVILIFTWLIFFPNAPYIITDLFHLQKNLQMPVWFDTTLITSFAWVGIIYGILSLWDIEQLMRKFLSTRTTTILITLFLFLSAFGIYIGRYLRWNSWDIVQQPKVVMYDVGARLIDPINHPRAWGMTLFMGVLLNLMYWSFKLLRNRKPIVNS